LDAPPLPPEQAFLRGIDLYHAGFLWEAHEQWESVWRVSSDPMEREFLQGLVQIAASLLKARSGNARGAAKLARRAREHLARVDGERYMGLELAPLRAFDGDAPRLEIG
jgi:predicted metal-dependent hydrolase